MTDLITFLRARTEEDRQAALAAGSQARYDEWDAAGSRVDDEIGRSHWEVVGIAQPPMTPAARAVSEHIATWDPKRVLADVEAKRQIIDAWENHLASVEHNKDDYDHQQYARDAASGLEIAVRALAAVYAAHPDFRDEWRPQEPF